MDNKTTKVLVYSAVTLVAGVSAYFLGKKVIQAIKQDSKQSVKDAEKAIKVSELTKPETWYSQNADRLHAAMDGAGTTDATITDVIKGLNTQSDWNKLVSAFGIRKSTAWLSSFEGNLLVWLEDELSPSEFTEIKNVLKTKNIII